MYTPSEDTSDVVSAIPICPGDTDVCPARDSVLLFDKSPALRKLANKNKQLLKREEYTTDEAYELFIRRSLEILPGNKSYLFFGGDAEDIHQLSTLAKVASSIEYKTWLIKISSDALLNDYYLNSMMDSFSANKNVWIYKYGTYDDLVLHDYPVLSYTEDDDADKDELSQFPSEYTNFNVKLYARE